MTLIAGPILADFETPFWGDAPGFPEETDRPARRLAARLMREIVVDHARRRHARKRGGDPTLLGLGGVDAGGEQGRRGARLDEALIERASFDQRAGRVVELRSFAGLSIAGTAAIARSASSA
jgi:hypothetical protein